jgi:hypothetical protein
LLQQLFVGAELSKLACVDDGDAVGAARGGQAVGDDDGRAAAQDVVERMFDPGFGLEVDVGHGLVEDQDARFRDHGAA